MGTDRFLKLGKIYKWDARGKERGWTGQRRYQRGIRHRVVGRERANKEEPERATRARAVTLPCASLILAVTNHVMVRWKRYYGRTI